MNGLEKIVIPPVAGIPSSPYVPAYTSSYSYSTPSYTTTVVQDAYGNSYIQQTSVGYTIHTVYTNHPAQAAVVGTETVPADYQLGWNAGATSRAVIEAEGYARFSITSSSVGIVVGFKHGEALYYVAEAEHAFFFRGGVASVMELGVEKTGSVAFATTDVFTITRSDRIVRYFKNSTLVYTSLAISDGDITLEAAMYSGGDTIYSTEIGVLIPGNVNLAASDNAFELMYSVGSEGTYSDGVGSILPLLGTGEGPAMGNATASFELMSSYASATSYAISNSIMEPVASDGTGGTFNPTLAISYNYVEALLGSGFGVSTLGSVTPSTSLGDNTAGWAQSQWYGYTVTIVSGTGIGQTATIVDNNSQTLFIDGAWVTPLDSTSRYEITLGISLYYQGIVSPEEIALQPLSSNAAAVAYAEADGRFLPIEGDAIQALPITSFALISLPSPYSVIATVTEQPMQGVVTTLPTLLLSAYCGHSASLTLPAITLVASVTVPAIARLDATLPALEITSSVTTGGYASASLTITDSYSIVAYSGAVAELVAPNEPYRILAASSVGGLARAYLAIGQSYDISAHITTEGLASADMILPALRMGDSGIARLVGPSLTMVATVTHLLATTYDAYVINTTTGAVSRYSNYPFDNIVRLGKYYYGINSSGVYKLGGELDITTSIPAKIKTFDTTLGSNYTKRVPYVYVAGRAPEGLVIGVTADEGTEYEYETDWGEQTVAMNHRAVVGKNIRGAYYSFAVSNVNGAAMDLDKITVHVAQSVRSL